MKFGEFAKLTEAVSLADLVTSENPILDTQPMNYLPESDGGQQRQVNRYKPQQQEQPITENASVTSADLSDTFDALFAAGESALSESIETPTPRPAVSQKDFVNKATKAQNTGDFSDAKKQTMHKQEKADLIKTDDISNGQLAARGNQFKKFINKNFTATAKDKQLVESITTAFDMMVLGKLG